MKNKKGEEKGQAEAPAKPNVPGASCLSILDGDLRRPFFELESYFLMGISNGKCWCSVVSKHDWLLLMGQLLLTEMTVGSCQLSLNLHKHSSVWSGEEWEQILFHFVTFSAKKWTRWEEVREKLEIGVRWDEVTIQLEREKKYWHLVIRWWWWGRRAQKLICLKATRTRRSMSRNEETVTLCQTDRFYPTMNIYQIDIGNIRSTIEKLLQSFESYIEIGTSQDYPTGIE